MCKIDCFMMKDNGHITMRSYEKRAVKFFVELYSSFLYNTYIETISKRGSGFYAEYITCIRFKKL